jgi:hypothetical protein
MTSSSTNDNDDGWFLVRGLYVHRDELEYLGYDTSGVDRELMAKLAEAVAPRLMMPDSYYACFCNTVWECADELGIPRR